MASTATLSQAYQVHLVDTTRALQSPTLLNNLSLANVPIPTPGPNSVVLRVRAVALNFRDLLVLSDNYALPTTPGIVPCLDAAGEIYSAGLGSRWQSGIGTKVIVALSKDWVDGDVAAWRLENVLGATGVDGTLAQFVVLHDDFLVRAPRNISFEEAATLSCAGGSATNILSSVAVNQGSTILTQGTGGVSCFVIQVCSRVLSLVIKLRR
jgi:NADPH:quinone reductase-like Zn-dependent oxidoreductase